MLTQGPSTSSMAVLQPAFSGLVERHHELDFGGGDRGEFLVDLTTFINQLTAIKSSEIAKLDREEGYRQIGALNITAWLRYKLHESSRPASNEARTARRLEELPVARETFEKGEISFTHASIIARTVEEVGNQPNPDYGGEPDQPRDVEELLVGAARQMDPGDLYKVCKQIELYLKPEDALADAEEQREKQYLEYSQTFDGMWYLQGMLAPEEGAIVATALEAAMPAPTQDDKRSGTQRRAQALVDLMSKVLDRGELPTHDGERPHLALLVDFSTLRGEPGDAAILDRSGQPVPGKTAERIACDCILTPIVRGEKGDVLRVGDKHRLFTPKQSLAMALRDKHCAFPGCDRPAIWTDNHHLVSWLNGGKTEIGNGAKMCRQHHILCHEGGWTLSRDPDGEYRADPP